MISTTSLYKTHRNVSHESGAGYTMVELIITIAVLSFGVLGVYTFFHQFTILNSNLSYRLTASYLAQEGLEVIRNTRDSNYVRRRVWTLDHLLDNCVLGCQLEYTSHGADAEGPPSHMSLYNPNTFLKIDANEFYGYGAGANTKFTRKVTVTQQSADVLKVVASVMWNYNGQSYNFDAEEYLYNWY